MELSAMKNDFVQNFLSCVNTKEDVTKLKMYMTQMLRQKNLTTPKKSPIAFTVDELMTELDKSEEDIRCNRVYTEEEMEKCFKSLV